VELSAAPPNHRNRSSGYDVSSVHSPFGAGVLVGVTDDDAVMEMVFDEDGETLIVGVEEKLIVGDLLIDGVFDDDEDSDIDADIETDEVGDREVDEVADGVIEPVADGVDDGTLNVCQRIMENSVVESGLKWLDTIPNRNRPGKVSGMPFVLIGVARFTFTSRPVYVYPVVVPEEGSWTSRMVYQSPAGPGVASGSSHGSVDDVVSPKIPGAPHIHEY